LGDTNMRLRIFGEEVVGIQKIKCPNHKCGRRIFDIGITRFRIIVELKCPHCGEVVRVYWKPKEKKKYT